MWRSINMHNLGDLHAVRYDLQKICMHAVDRSKGELRGIDLEYLGTDELLQYITERTNDLRRLRLFGCYCISDEGLSEAALKLQCLEELEITYCTNLSENVLAVVGQCCPKLKSFKLNYKGFVKPHWESDRGAQAIAENMHELQHLQLFGNKLTNSGLLAILDGCPQLQTLDLRQCFNVSLQGDLEKRCVKQIKHLRRPNDSTEDYEYDATLCDHSDEDGSGMSDDDDDYDYDYEYEYDYELELSDENSFDHDHFFEEYQFENM